MNRKLLFILAMVFALAPVLVQGTTRTAAAPTGPYEVSWRSMWSQASYPRVWSAHEQGPNESQFTFAVAADRRGYSGRGSVDTAQYFRAACEAINDREGKDEKHHFRFFPQCGARAP